MSDQTNRHDMAKTKHPTLRTPSEIYKDFIVVKATEITELQCFLTELIHQPTGCSDYAYWK